MLVGPQNCRDNYKWSLAYMGSIITSILFPERLDRSGYFRRLLVFALCLGLILAFRYQAKTSTALSILLTSSAAIGILLMSFYALVFISDSNRSGWWLIASRVPVVNIFLGIILLFTKPVGKPEIPFIGVDLPGEAELQQMAECEAARLRLSMEIEASISPEGFTKFVDGIIARHACGQSEIPSPVIDFSEASRLRLIACYFCRRIWEYYSLDWASEVFRQDKASPGGYVSNVDWENPKPRDAVKIAEDYCVGLATREQLERAHQEVRDFAEKMSRRLAVRQSQTGRQR